MRFIITDLFSDVNSKYPIYQKNLTFCQFPQKGQRGFLVCGAFLRTSHKRELHNLTFFSNSFICLKSRPPTTWLRMTFMPGWKRNGDRKTDVRIGNYPPNNAENRDFRYLWHSLPIDFMSPLTIDFGANTAISGNMKKRQ